ncbi:hypothetical protein V8F06_009823 [Rhypophila decipiens]
MHFSQLAVAGLFLGPELVAARAHRVARRGVNCYFEMPAEPGATCENLSSSWGTPLDLFLQINPGVSCPDLEVGKVYCVLGEYVAGDDTTTTTTTTSSTSTSKTSTSTTTTSSKTTSTTTTSKTTITPTPTPSNQPQMPGVAANCNRFYKIRSGDTCENIAQANGITFAQLRSWNTEINASCSNLWLDYYICTRVPGATTVPTTTTTAPQPSNSPAQPGAAKNCEKWYKIVSGDTCDKVAAKNKITTAQLSSWNNVGTNCNGLQLGAYACVGVPGAATPMPNIVSNCSRFSLVVSGDTCENIATKYFITVANFKKWNPYLNSQCSNLWLGALVCTNV